MSQFFYADKGSREKAFAFDNVNSDSNDALVHPMPALLGNGQKVDMSPQERVGGDESTPDFGADIGGSHVRMTGGPSEGVMPGENPDPRC